MRFPPQLSAAAAAAIETVGEAMDAAVESSVQTNFFVSMLLGASAQELFGMIRQL